MFIRTLTNVGANRVSYSYQFDAIARQFKDVSSTEVASLMVDRGDRTKETNMTTLGLQMFTHQDKVYRILSNRGVKEDTASSAFVRDLESSVKISDNAPDHVEFLGIWDTTFSNDGTGMNVFGGTGTLNLRLPSIDIPLVEATEEALSYYGATLVYDGDLVSFPKDFPIWLMDYGKNYLQDFINTPEGQGLYLEYHHDQPHFHMPLDNKASGFYLLAREVGEGKYHATAFQIPYGKAVYTKQGAIHCDAALTGNWGVGYNITKDYSTVLLRSDGERTNVQVH